MFPFHFFPKPAFVDSRSSGTNIWDQNIESKSGDFIFIFYKQFSHCILQMFAEALFQNTFVSPKRLCEAKEYFDEIELQAMKYGLSHFGVGQWTLIINDPVIRNLFKPSRTTQSLSDKWKKISNDPAFGFLKLEPWISHHKNLQHKSGQKCWDDKEYFVYYRGLTLSGATECFPIYVPHTKWPVVPMCNYCRPSYDFSKDIR